MFCSPIWAQPPRPIQPEDVFELEAASSPQISADGMVVAFVRRTNDIETDRTRSAIWLVSADGENLRPLTAANGESHTPRWSPDGQFLAFVMQSDTGASLQVYDRENGRVTKLTNLETGLNDLAWSPDGEHIAWAAFVMAPGVAAAPLPDRGEHDWAPAAQVEDRLNFRFDGSGNIPNGRLQLFLMAVDGAEVRQLTDDELGASGDFAWDRDGASLVFSADRRSDGEGQAPDSELFRLMLEDGSITRLTDRRGPDTNPQPSPDGRHLAYLGFDDQRMGYHNTELYLAGPDAGEPVSLTEALDRTINAYQWSADGQSLYIQYDDHGGTDIARVSLDGAIEPVASGLIGPTFGRAYTGGSFSVSDTDVLAVTAGSSMIPAEIAVGPAGGELTRITDLNADILPRLSLSEAEDIRWASPHDGREIQGWVLYPPDFDPSREYPLLLEIHGGPFSAYGPSFSAEFQLYAAAGYVVLYTNPRGSTSYGYEFANLIHHDYPGHDYDDLMGAVDHMIARGFIDEERLFVTGGSGGGVLTAWIIGNTDRFAAAAVVKPVINWSSFVLYSDLPQFFYRYWFASAPWEDPEEYWRRSPLSLVGNVSTPTLMMVGGADVRTPRSETEQYYSALHLRGVPTRLVVIPDSFHSISNSRPSRLLSKVGEILRWFDMYDPGAEAD
nr:S9 family peptidase [Maricaulis parjimensis]